MSCLSYIRTQAVMSSYSTVAAIVEAGLSCRATFLRYTFDKLMATNFFFCPPLGACSLQKVRRDNTMLFRS